MENIQKALLVNLVEYKVIKASYSYIAEKLSGQIMTSKWTVYFLTFITYALFHSIRSTWSGLKNMFYDPPFDYSVHFLGVVDMLVVFILAISLSTLGHRVERYGARKCLLIGMFLLIVITTILGVLLVEDVTSKALYILLYGFGIGIFSATGWPACLYLLSQYFDKKSSTSLPIWNGTSQFGDFLALLISDIIIEALNADVSITLLIIPIIMVVVFVFNVIYLPKDKVSVETEDMSKDINQLNEEKNIEEKSQQEKQKPLITIVPQVIVNSNVQESIKKTFGQKPILSQKQQTETKNSEQTSKQSKQIQLVVENFQPLKNQSEISGKELSEKEVRLKVSEVVLETTVFDTTPVNFSNVWCLPGVALYVISNAVIKSVNSIIMTWLVFYLSMPEVDMRDESRVIAILWAMGVLGGSIIGGKVNAEYSKIKFMVCMFISGAMFLTLENMSEKLYEIEIVITIIICSLSFGVPYNMLSTAVPIMLSQKDEIKHRPGAKAAIISLMQGFGMGLCGFSILLVPLIGVQFIHIVLALYCLVSIIILGVAEYIQRRENRTLPKDSESQRQQQGQSSC